MNTKFILDQVKIALKEIDETLPSEAKIGLREGSTGELTISIDIPPNRSFKYPMGYHLGFTYFGDEEISCHERHQAFLEE